MLRLTATARCEQEQAPIVTGDELTALLHRDIPIAQAIGITVLQAESECVLLTAPLAPNINHVGTLFGGSANTLATLAAADILIQRSRIDYRSPISGEVTARFRFDDAPRWARFVQSLERHNRARLSLRAEVLGCGRIGACFEGDFVAVRSAPQ